MSMRSISQVSFVKRATAVLAASMFLLSGIVLTAGPANAATTETVPYTYTVKVPVTKIVYEYQVVKTTVGKRVVYTYQKVAKTKIEYRIETRTGYREAPVKVADKPAAAQYKVQVASTASFQNVTKEIVVTPAAPGANKVNLSSQLAGSVGDTAYVRVVAKNAAGKSTPGRAAKLEFGEVSRSNYDVQVPYTATGTRQTAAGYWYSYTDYSKPTYSSVYTQTGGGYYSYQQTGGGYNVWSQTAAGYYRSELIYGGYWSTSSYQESYSATCYYVPGYSWSAYSCTKTRTVTSQVWNPPYYVQRWVEPTYGNVWVAATYGNVWIAPSYGYVSQHTGYGTSEAYQQPTYENYNYTAYNTETRVAITNGWKASN